MGKWESQFIASWLSANLGEKRQRTAQLPRPEVFLISQTRGKPEGHIFEGDDS